MLYNVDVIDVCRMFSAILSHEHIGYCIDEITPEAISRVFTIFFLKFVTQDRICFVPRLCHSTRYRIIA